MHASVIVSQQTEPRLIAVRQAVAARSGGFTPSISSTIAMLIERALPAIEAELGISSGEPQ
jgi:hypothetical protein